MTTPLVRYNEFTPGRHSWIRWMTYRVHKCNQNNLIVVVGKTGQLKIGDFFG